MSEEPIVLEDESGCRVQSLNMELSEEEVFEDMAVKTVKRHLKV